jgi:hypothetical protein
MRCQRARGLPSGLAGLLIAIRGPVALDLAALARLAPAVHERLARAGIQRRARRKLAQPTARLLAPMKMALRRPRSTQRGNVPFDLYRATAAGPKAIGDFIGGIRLAEADARDVSQNESPGF